MGENGRLSFQNAGDWNKRLTKNKCRCKTATVREAYCCSNPSRHPLTDSNVLLSTAKDLSNIGKALNEILRPVASEWQDL